MEITVVLPLLFQFYADAMQYEYDMNAATYELKQSLAANSAEGEGGPALIFKNIQVGQINVYIHPSSALNLCRPLKTHVDSCRLL